MYPPPYHNPVMKSGEWKLWLEAVLGRIRGLDVARREIRDSGTVTIGSSWTELWEVPAVQAEKKGNISMCVGGYSPGDPDVVLLLHFDGTGDFLDSTGRHAFTVAGGADESGEGVWSSGGDFGPRTDYIYCTDNIADFKFAKGQAFTIEFWVKRHAATDTAFVFDIAASGYVAEQYLLILLKMDGSVEVAQRDAYISTATGKIIVDEWHHIALVRKTDGSVNLYVDGTSSASATWDVKLESDKTNVLTIGNRYNSGRSDAYLDELRVSRKAQYTSDFTPPAFPFSGGGEAKMAQMRLLVNGVVRNTVEAPAIARHFFEVDELSENDVISIEASLDGGGDVDWWGTYEASSAGIETTRGLRYPAPEYENSDPRWIGRWTDIYKMLVAAEPRTGGAQKKVQSDEAASDAYAYTASTTTTICEVAVETGAGAARIECFARSLFTGFELHKNGSKIADLSIFSQKGEDGGLTSSTLCHDIVFSDVTAGTHTFALKGVATATESGHMEAQLHVIYE